jgi:hypothetical protein
MVGVSLGPVAMVPGKRGGTEAICIATLPVARKLSSANGSVLLRAWTAVVGLLALLGVAAKAAVPAPVGRGELALPSLACVGLPAGRAVEMAVAVLTLGLDVAVAVALRPMVDSPGARRGVHATAAEKHAVGKIGLRGSLGARVA